MKHTWEYHFTERGRGIRQCKTCGIRVNIQNHKKVGECKGISKDTLAANLAKDLTLEELQSLKPDRVRASNDLYEACKYALGDFQYLQDKYPFTVDKLEKAIAKADGGK